MNWTVPFVFVCDLSNVSFTMHLCWFVLGELVPFVDEEMFHYLNAIKSNYSLCCQGTFGFTPVLPLLITLRKSLGISSPQELFCSSKDLYFLIQMKSVHSSPCQMLEWINFNSLTEPLKSTWTFLIKYVLNITSEKCICGCSAR